MFAGEPMEANEATKRLDAAQQEAVLTEGHLAIAAVPGSGKTTVLVHRVAQLLEAGCDPERILVLTFLKKTQEELASRLTRMASRLGVGVVQPRTYHSVGLGIIKSWGENIRRGYSRAHTMDAFQIYGMAIRIMKEQARETGNRHLLAKKEGRGITTKSFLRYCDAAYDLFFPKAGEFSIDDHMNLLASCGLVDYLEDEAEFLLHCWREFDAEKVHGLGLGYIDMLDKAHLLLQDEKVAQAEGAKYDHVMVDEFQDTSPLQQEMFLSISSQSDRFIVGDPDQTIFSWRRARPGLLVDAMERDEFNTVRLERNYRSGRIIVAAAQNLIEHNAGRVDNVMEPVRDGGRVDHSKFVDRKSECDWVAKRIKAAIDNGYPPSEILVLGRTNALIGRIAEALVLNDVKFRVPPGTETFASLDEVKDMSAYLALAAGACGKNAGKHIKRIANRPLRYCKRYQTDEVIQEVAEGRDVVEALYGSDDNGLNELGHQIDVAKRHVDSGKTPFGVAHSIVRSVGYREWLTQDPEDEDSIRTENLETFFEVAKRCESIDHLLDVIKAMGGQRRGGHKTCILLSTIHKAKGLESRVVHVVGFEPGLMPHSAASRSIDEERRLAYVACTRAKDVLVITESEEFDLGDLKPEIAATSFVRELGLDTIEDAAENPPRPAGTGYLPSAKPRRVPALPGIGVSDEPTEEYE